MKRGRPTVRTEIQKEIIEALSSTNLPMTVSGMARNISTKLNRRISWNTIEKYTRELVAMDKVAPITLPHSKKSGESGLVVYTMKR